MAVEEFSLIERYFRQQPFSSSQPGIDLGIGDDGAILNPPTGQRLCVVVDTLVEGVHFPGDSQASDVGYKALAVNLSDLAAMGARPYAFTLALTLPKVQKDWLEGFSQGLFDLARQFDIPLIGGDTTRGPLTVSVQALGLLPAMAALTRSGAQAGDDIYVSGNIGDAGLGLAIHQSNDVKQISSKYRDFLLSRLNRPTPRIELGQSLLGLANAAIDISDGLWVDLEHILTQSGLGAEVNPDRIPLSPACEEVLLAKNLDARIARIHAAEMGDDYELCFTASKSKRKEIEALVHICNLSRIGSIVSGKGIQCINDLGETAAYEPHGFTHF